LRDNPNPEVVLNLEIKNISDESTSKVKILWLDPDRNLYFEEEKLVSIPENCIFNGIYIFLRPRLMLNKIENELVL